MGWRDLIVTSQQPKSAHGQSTRKGFVDIVDIVPRYENKDSFFLGNLPQNSKPPEPSTISTKPYVPAVARIEPMPPLHRGWVVVYRDGRGLLRGGADERDLGTVTACTWDGRSWTVLLTNGDRLPLARVMAVSKTDHASRIVAAWTVRGCGYDGEQSNGRRTNG